MKPITAAALVCIAGAVLAGSAALAAQEWTTSGVDAQRTSWVRGDDRLTKASIADGTFTFLWKAQFDNRTRGIHSLTPPVLLDRLIGYRGFKALAFVGGSADRVFAIDTDLNKPYWNVQLNYAAPTGGPPPITAECAGALTAIPGRRTALVQSASGRGGGGGRAGARSAVGEPGRGAWIMSQPPRGRGPAAPPPAPPAQASRGGRARGAVAGVPFGGVDPLYVVGTDGFLRVLRTSDGADAEPGAPFLPPGAMASALVFVDGAVYTTTSNGCGASPNGVWMIDMTTPERAVTSWHTGGPNIVGRSGLAFGTDGTVFVTVGAAGSAGKPSAAATQFADSVVALDGSTLTVKDWFSAPGAKFNTSPMVVRHDNRDLVIVTGDDGKMYVLDGASLGGTNHRTPLHVTSAYSEPSAGGSLTTWESQGTRWILAPAAGASKPGLAFAINGPAPLGRIVAFKLSGTAGKVTLEPGWASRNVPTPLGPIVVNGVVFAVASGSRSTRAVLYALDGDTGRELWTSRAAITSFAQGGLVAGAGQVYVVTYDNTMYAFGIPMEH